MDTTMIDPRSPADAAAYTEAVFEQEAARLDDNRIDERAEAILRSAMAEAGMGSNQGCPAWDMLCAFEVISRQLRQMMLDEQLEHETSIESCVSSWLALTDD